MTGNPQPSSSQIQEEKPQIKWVVPEGWKSGPPSSMRYASFKVVGKSGETGDASVSVFGGDGGGDLKNVNRWRSQIGLDPIGENDLKSLLIPVNSNDGSVLTVDMTGPKNHILAGWYKTDGKTWFFKLIGPDELVTAEKPSFMKFLQSVQFHP
jgi:hypothetical protein